ncbi:uncharacterized protein SEPMUDRAFT_158077 [Sphaerulina musiva SO2202]|uniref:Uncharacterized protein n=1 Tax=Sphaerulina musiva (strain SO2202) TaxID=692275 RepID=M3CYU1_SPHMS|nr:uncharacterized protein SEPMUDRAFT_158077 [Sphaerulina musiva SO2202]EMF09824.1 hypothetical protein SEPMUDRAFT_158077 [Sphaerulina musiva SO2202]
MVLRSAWFRGSQGMEGIQMEVKKLDQQSLLFLERECLTSLCKRAKKKRNREAVHKWRENGSKSIVLDVLTTLQYVALRPPCPLAPYNMQILDSFSPTKLTQSFNQPPAAYPSQSRTTNTLTMSNMPTTLLDLSDELLAHICSYAMISLAADDNNNNNNNNDDNNTSSSPQTSNPTTPSNPRPKFPTPINGVITEQISKRLRHLLQPFRCCHRLYKIAKYQFLESNVIVLNLSDIRGSASRLEFTSGTTQMIMTGNPDPLLRNLVHVQLVGEEEEEVKG